MNGGAGAGGLVDGGDRGRCRGSASMRRPSEGCPVRASRAHRSANTHTSTDPRGSRSCPARGASPRSISATAARPGPRRRSGPVARRGRVQGR